jgi:hypothetical protein
MYLRVFSEIKSVLFNSSHISNFHKILSNVLTLSQEISCSDSPSYPSYRPSFSNYIAQSYCGDVEL